MRILITGSRDWPFQEVVHRAIEDAIFNYISADPPPEGTRYAEGVTIVHGACEFGGADIHAQAHALVRGYTNEPHPVGQKSLATHGKRAYYLRNQQMVDAGADICLAFNYNNSRGTTMTIDLAKKAGIPVKEFTA